jgi:hypothetical protein
MIEMIGDIHVNTHKNQENIFMFSDCTPDQSTGARSYIFTSPGINPRFDSIFHNNAPVLKRTFACPRLKHDFPSFLSSLYVQTTNIYWRNSSLFSTTHPTFLHSWSMIISVIKWSSVKIYVWSAFFHFRQYPYHVTRFVIFFSGT